MAGSRLCSTFFLDHICLSFWYRNCIHHIIEQILSVLLYKIIAFSYASAFQPGLQRYTVQLVTARSLQCSTRRDGPAEHVTRSMTSGGYWSPIRVVHHGCAQPLYSCFRCPHVQLMTTKCIVSSHQWNPKHWSGWPRAWLFRFVSLTLYIRLQCEWVQSEAQSG